jgi:hypothetical protein
MKWFLLGIFLSGDGNHSVVDFGAYDSMNDCFNARDSILVKLDAFDGVPPVNTQFLCIKSNYGDKK